MKKENKKMAQQRRAEERRRKELKKKITIIGAVVLSILLVVIIIVAAYKSSSTSDNGGNSTDASLSNKTNEVSYLIDTSLTVEDGDTVNIDYVGYIDGVAFDGGNTKGKGTDLTIGSGKYIDDFEEQLIGSHPGDTVEVNVTFPEKYGNKELAGKDALFEVVVNGIYE